jgi:hypothetical protein
MVRKITIASSRAALVCPAVALLAIAGCGGTTKTVTTSTTPLPAGVERAPPEPQAINATYHVTLNGYGATRFGLPPGFRRGARNGSARAVVTTNASTHELCWKFSQLTNVPSPTVARLFRDFEGATGKGGFLLGRRYKSSGCIHLAWQTLGLIGEKPYKFFLNIHNAQYPEGAVRGSL